MFFAPSVPLDHSRSPRAQLPVLSLFASLIITLILYAVVRDHQSRDVQHLFEDEAAKLVGGMRQSMTASEVLLSSAAGLLSAHPEISPEQWRRFVDVPGQRERFPGFQGIAFLRYADSHARPAYAGLEPVEGLSVTTRDGRPLLLDMAEPSPWRNAIDLIGGDGARVSAMERARDLDEPSRTALVHFSDPAEASHRPGFLIYAPVYSPTGPSATVADRRRSLAGFVVMPFAADLLIPGLMQDRYREASQHFRIEVFDGPVPVDDRRYFDSALYEGFAPNHALLSTTIVSQRFGTELSFRFSSLPDYESRQISRLPEIVAGSGLVLSLLLFALLERFEKRGQIVEAARRDTAALRVELGHRVKNVLAVVQSLANRSLSGEQDSAQRLNSSPIASALLRARIP